MSTQTTCSKCGTAGAEFYENGPYWCKSCSIRATMKSRRKNPEGYRTYQREYKRNHRHKSRARIVLNDAILRGKMARVETCLRCGSSENIEGHHEDYDKPLDVEWLCLKCHRRHHSAKRD